MEQYEHHELSHEESLRVITSMIRSAQGTIAHNGFDFIFWGWLLVAASAGHLALLAIKTAIDPSAVYLIMPAGGLYMWWHHRREAKHERVQTHVDLLMPYVWGSFAAMLFLGNFFCAYLNTSPIPWILLFIGSATFISGGALKFRPLMIGGATFWSAAAVSFFLDIPAQVVVQGTAMIAGYLIPGYILLRTGQRANV